MTQSRLQTLPPLSDIERAHGERLTALIRNQIQGANGWIDFERFMELALYAPGLGYYSAGAHKFGPRGDFVTAPEISPLFGSCMATQCAAVLHALQGGSVLELGAGSGAMAADILLQLERMEALPELYCILEVSAELKQRQQATLRQRVPQLAHKVRWLDALPAEFTGIILANEVLDALPVQRFVIEGQQVQALGVGIKDDGFAWQTQPASAPLRHVLQEILQNLGTVLPDGYRSEINLRLKPWFHSLAASLVRGAMLFVDYGLPQAEYYGSERANGTLACFFRHRIHDDPFVNVGLQDITAWVDFTAVAEAGIAAGLELRGFATQAHFLLGAGLDAGLNQPELADDVQRWKLSQQIQKLTLPSEMGESFKAIAFAKQCDVELSGFRFRDLRDRL